MLQICYSSLASRDFDDLELAELLKRARTHNQAQGISGLLLYEKRTFIQVLEGEGDIVTPLLARIRTDRQHAQLLVLYRQEVQQRSFPEWSMGFFEVVRPSVQKLTGYNEFFNADFSAAAFAQDADRVRDLLLQFRNGNWHRQVKAA